MKILLYYIKNSWCFMTVSIHHKNIYWIDWIGVNYIDGEINFEHIIQNSNINIICTDGDNYFYYRTSRKKAYPLNDTYKIFSIDSKYSIEKIKSFSSTYSELYYKLSNNTLLKKLQL